MEPINHTEPQEDQPQPNPAAAENHENHSHMAGRRSGGPRFLLWVVVAAIIILLIAWMKPAGDDVMNNSTDDSSDETSLDDSSANATISSTSFTNPNDWDLLERAESTINSYLGDGQDIEFGIVQDPTDENTVYFASSAIDGEENLISIYKYQTDDYNFERLFRKTYEPGKDALLAEDLLPAFHVIGYDDGNLVLFVKSVETSLEACAQPVLLGSSESDSAVLVTVSIDNPYDALEDYVPNQEVLDEALADQATCEAGLE